MNSGNYNAVGNKTYYGQTFDVKSDHHFNGNNTVSGYYSFNKVTALITGLVPNNAAGFNPGSGESASVAASSSYRTWEPYGYIQDDWRASRWLTLNLGLRYDVFTPKTEIRDRISNLDIITGQVLYPGFDIGYHRHQDRPWRYRPAHRLRRNRGQEPLVRGGYGISFYPGDINSGALLKNPPFTPSQSCGPTTTTPCSAYGNYGTLAQGMYLPRSTSRPPPFPPSCLRFRFRPAPALPRSIKTSSSATCIKPTCSWKRDSVRT